MIELEFLKEQNVSESLIHGIEEFRKNYNVDEGLQPEFPDHPYRSTEKKSWKCPLQDFWKEKIFFLQAQRPREKISWQKICICFGRPVYNVSFHAIRTAET
mgnify:CR=1 FL=1